MMKAFRRGKGGAALLFAGVADISDKYWTARVKMTREGASPPAFWHGKRHSTTMNMSDERQRRRSGKPDTWSTNNGWRGNVPSHPFDHLAAVNTTVTEDDPTPTTKPKLPASSAGLNAHPLTPPAPNASPATWLAKKNARAQFRAEETHPPARGISSRNR